MNRTILLVLTGMIIVAVGVSAVIVASQVSGAGSVDDVAKLLPYNTIVYVRASDLSRLYEAMRESGFRERLLEQLHSEKPRAAEDFKAWDKLAGKLRCIHLGFTGMTRYKRGTDIDLLLVAELGKGERLPDLVPPSLKSMVVEDESCGDVQTYRVEYRGMQREGLNVFLACRRNQVVASTDRVVMRKFLEAAEDGRAESLADNKRYQQVTEGGQSGGLQAYVSGPDLINVIERNVERHDRDEFRMVTEAVGLRHVKSAWFSADYAGQTCRLRMLMDPESDAYKMIALPATVKKLPQHLPESTVFFAAGSAGEGQKMLHDFHRYLVDKLLQFGEIENAEEYYEEVREAEEEMGINFDEAASQVDGEIGIFFDRVLDDDGLCFFGAVKDIGKGLRLVEALARAVAAEETNEKTVHGITVHTAGRRGVEIAWSAIDRSLFLSPSEEVMERCVRATKEGHSLGESPGYRAIWAQLPAENVIAAYFNFGPIVRQPEGHSNDVSLSLRNWLSDLAIGAAVTTADGLIEVRLAHSKKQSLAEQWEFLGDLLAGQEKQSATRACVANLRQAALSCMVYSEEFGEGRFYPRSLDELVEKGVLGEEGAHKLFVCPARAAAKQGRGGSSYESAFDLSDDRLDRNRLERPSELIFIWDNAPRHNGMRCAAFADGHVQLLPEADFQKRLAALKEEIARLAAEK